MEFMRQICLNVEYVTKYAANYILQYISGFPEGCDITSLMILYSDVSVVIQSLSELLAEVNTPASRENFDRIDNIQKIMQLILLQLTTKFRAFLTEEVAEYWSLLQATKPDLPEQKPQEYMLKLVICLFMSTYLSDQEAPHSCCQCSSTSVWAYTLLFAGNIHYCGACLSIFLHN
jgi:hypothetical protein